MLKMLCGAALLAASGPASAPMQWIQYPTVHQVSCMEGSGTAFRVGKTHFLSVAHVTALHFCTVEGKPIAVTNQDGDHDFSELEVPLPRGGGLPISCEGFVPGQWYWSSGFANAAPFQTNIALYATFLKDRDGKRVLIGESAVIPGMSGGPVMDSAGRVVGTVNAFVRGSTISLSRELKDTAVCRENIA